VTRGRASESQSFAVAELPAGCHSLTACPMTTADLSPFRSRSRRAGCRPNAMRQTRTTDRPSIVSAVRSPFVDFTADERAILLAALHELRITQSAFDDDPDRDTIPTATIRAKGIEDLVVRSVGIRTHRCSARASGGLSRFERGESPAWLSRSEGCLRAVETSSQTRELHACNEITGFGVLPGAVPWPLHPPARREGPRRGPALRA
jgi:hypothetical protein